MAVIYVCSTWLRQVNMLFESALDKLQATHTQSQFKNCLWIFGPKWKKKFKVLVSAFAATITLFHYTRYIKYTEKRAISFWHLS